MGKHHKFLTATLLAGALLSAPGMRAEASAGADASVTGCIVNSITDGTEPFDANDSAGNDSNGNNRVVRTFDTTVYSLEFVTNMDRGSQKRSLSQADVNIEMSVPGAKGDYRWDTSSMGWLLSGSKVSYDNGRVTLTGKIRLSQIDGVDPVPGTSAANIYLVASGVANGTKVKPTFKVWMDGDDPSTARSFVCDDSHTTSDGKRCTVTVSADASRFGIYTPNSTNTRWGYLNPSTGKLQLQPGAGYIPATIHSQSLGFYLRGEEGGKWIKGCEVPKGDITFIVEPVYKDQDGKTGKALLWDSLNLHLAGQKYDEVAKMSSIPGTTYGRETFWATSYGSGSSYQAYLPLYPEEKGVQLQSFSDPGDFKVEPLSDGRFKVTMSGYTIDGNFPRYNRYRGAVGEYNFNDEVNLFTAFGAQWYCPLSSGDAGQSRVVTMKVTDINVRGVSGRKMSLWDGSTEINGAGSGATVSVTPLRDFGSAHRWSSTAYQGADRYFGGSTFDGLVVERGNAAGDGFVMRHATGSDIQDVGNSIYALDILDKFDDTSLEPRNTDGDLSLSKNGGWPDESGDYRLQGRQWKGERTALFAVKPDGTGWKDMEEAKAAGFDDLRYYATREEAESHGKLVGILWEFRNMEWHNRCWLDAYSYYRVRDDAPIDHVAWAVPVTRTWCAPTAEIGSKAVPGSMLGRDTVSKGGEPSHTWHPTGYVPMRYNSAEEGRWWVDGDYHVRNQGMCALIVAEMPKASIVSDVSGKSWWDLNAGERIMDLRLNPALTTSSKGQPSEMTAVVTLPKHLYYIKGTSNWGGTYVPADGAAPSQVVDGTPLEPVAAKDADGNTTLTWTFRGIKSGEAIDPVHFQLEIGTELDPKTDVNESNNPLNVKTQCWSKYGPQTGQVTWAARVIKSPAVSMQLRAMEPTIERNGKAAWRAVISNNAGADSKPFNQYAVLPYNGDNRDSSISGTPVLEGLVMDVSHGRDTYASNLKVWVTADKAVRDGSFDAQDLNVMNVRWEEVKGAKSGDTITYNIGRSDVTAVRISGNRVRAHEGINYILTVVPGEGSKGGDLHCLSASVYGERFPGTVFAARTPVQVVRRTVSGKVFNDRNKSGLLDIGDKADCWVVGQKVRILDASGKQAKDAFGKDIPDCVTDREGKWSFSEMVSGEFTVALIGPDGKYEPVKNGPDYGSDKGGAKKALTEKDSDCGWQGSGIVSSGRIVWGEEGYTREVYTFKEAAEMNPAVQEYGNVCFGLAVYWSYLTVEKVIDAGDAVAAFGPQTFTFKAEGTGWDGKKYTYYLPVTVGKDDGQAAPHDSGLPAYPELQADIEDIPGFTSVLEGRVRYKIPSGNYVVTELSNADEEFLDFITVNGIVNGGQASMDLLINEKGLAHARNWRTDFSKWRDSRFVANKLKK